MESCRKNLKIASTIIIIYGVIMSLYVMGYSVFLWVVGAYIFWLSGKDEEEIRKEKSLLFWLAMAFILLNFLAAIFLFMAIDHLAVTSTVSAENARYEDVYGTNVSEIGTPDHSFIVSELRMCG